MTNDELLNLIVEGIQERKGKNITHVDLTGLEYVSTEHFIICQGTSTMQVSAIADSVREYVQEKSGVKPFNYDGYRNSQWIVIDYGTIYVHVFLPEYREYYNLEQLWNDAEIKEIPDIDYAIDKKWTIRKSNLKDSDSAYSGCMPSSVWF